MTGLCDPMGSALYNFFKKNELSTSGESITEGIGTTRITKNFRDAKVDEAFQINDQYALDIIFDSPNFSVKYFPAPKRTLF